MRTTLPVYIGKDTIAKLIQYCDDHRLDTFTLVADQNTYPVLGQAVEDALANRGLDVNTIVLTGKEIIADEHYIVQVLLHTTGKIACILRLALARSRILRALSVIAPKHLSFPFLPRRPWMGLLRAPHRWASEN